MLIQGSWCKRILNSIVMGPEENSSSGWHNSRSGDIASMALLPAFFHFLTPPGAKAQFLFNHPISCLFLSLLSKRLENWECMQIGEEKTWLTVVVFGEACSEALTLFAPCNLRGLNVRVTPQGMSCKTRREDNKRHNKKSSSWASLLMKNKVLSSSSRTTIIID